MAQVFEKVSVIGLGYVGLPMAAILASRGLDVVGVDTSERVVGLINQGKIHIEEPDLDILVHEAVASGKLRATTVPEPADAFVIGVPTPVTADHKPDLSYVEAAARAIAPVLKKGDLLVLESTSPVGTTRKLAQWIAEARPDLTLPAKADEDADILVAHSPERILPGRVLLELVDNDRIIGGLTPRCAERAAEFYKVFIQGECLLTDANTAELVKLAENSFRDVNIAFANELSVVCDQLGVDIWELVRLANRHPRVRILDPGPGVGGHCIAVDPWFIVDSAPHRTALIRTARQVNDGKPGFVVDRVMELAAARGSPRIACLGLSYKADIDDLRESPAVEIVAALAGMKTGGILVVEPHIEALPAALEGLPGVSLVDLKTALAGAEVVVLLVDHQDFKTIDRAGLTDKAVFDTRGMWR